MNKGIKIIVAWSGGKDSQASLIWAVRKYGAANVTAVFCDTGWEHKLTYKHVQEICALLGVELVVVKSKKYKGMLDLAKKKKRFPSAKARFCTEKLKIEPMIDYILSLQQHVFIIQGIRADESESRSKMSPDCRYFKYYFEPYTDNNVKLAAVNKAIDKRAAKGQPPTEKQRKVKKKGEARLAAGKLDEKYYTYRKEEVFEFCKHFIHDLHRPMFHETENYVITYILDAGQKPNPLYYRGARRVGCYPCVLCNHDEMSEIISTPYDPSDPMEEDVIKKIRDGENLVGHSFFGPNYIPDAYCTGRGDKGEPFP